MKRRRFLALAGSAIAAPALPPAGLAATAGNPASAAGAGRSYAFVRAIFHPRAGNHLSLPDLAAKARISEPEARDLVARLLREGELVAGKAPGTYLSPARIVPPRPLRTTRPARPERSHQRRNRTSRHSDNPELMAYLRKMAQDYFATKGPRP